MLLIFLEHVQWVLRGTTEHIIARTVWLKTTCSGPLFLKGDIQSSQSTISGMKEFSGASIWKGYLQIKSFKSNSLILSPIQESQVSPTLTTALNRNAGEKQKYLGFLKEGKNFLPKASAPFSSLLELKRKLLVHDRVFQTSFLYSSNTYAVVSD